MEGTIKGVLMVLVGIFLFLAVDPKQGLELPHYIALGIIITGGATALLTAK